MYKAIVGMDKFDGCESGVKAFMFYHFSSDAWKTFKPALDVFAADAARIGAWTPLIAWSMHPTAALRRLPAEQDLERLRGW